METFEKSIDNLTGQIRKAREKLWARRNPEKSPHIDREKLWYQTPVSPLEFIDGPDFIGDRYDRRIWNAIRDDMNLIFSGPDRNGDSCYLPSCNIYLDNEGIGSGKSTRLAILNAYWAHLLFCMEDPLRYFNLFDSTLLILNVAPNEAKARQIVYAKTMSLINRINWFHDMNCLPETRLKSALKFYPRGYSTTTMSKRELEEIEKLERKGAAQTMPWLLIAPGPGRVNVPTGADLLVGNVDEACSDDGFETADQDYCESIFFGMNERRESRFDDQGMIALISSAGNEDRFMERYMLAIEGYCKKHGKDMDNIIEYEGKKILMRRRALYEASPKFQMYFDKGQYFEYVATRESEDGTVIEKTLKIPISFEEKFRLNPEGSLKNICSIPAVSAARFISEFNRILNNVNRLRSDPLPDTGKDSLEPKRAMDILKAKQFHPEDPKAWHYIHIDLATGKTQEGRDAVGFAMGHPGDKIDRGGVKLSTAVVDLSIRFKSDSQKVRKDAEGRMRPDAGEIRINEVLDFIFFLRDICGFRIAQVTFDKYQSAGAIQTLNDENILSDKKPCTNDSHENMKMMWYDGRIDCFNDRHLLWEMKRLEVKPGSGKIEKSVGASDDEVECVARVIEMCIEADEPEVKRPRPRARLTTGVLGTSPRPGSMYSRQIGLPMPKARRNR